MRVFAPAPALSPFVSDVMVVDVTEQTTRLRLPETGLVLGIRYRGAAELVRPARRLPDASLAGLASEARWMRTSAGGAVVLARFRPGGAAQFFSEPLHELFDAMVPLEALLSAADLARLQAQVFEASDDLARVAAMNRFLTGRLRPAARGRRPDGDR